MSNVSSMDEVKYRGLTMVIESENFRYSVTVYLTDNPEEDGVNLDKVFKGYDAARLAGQKHIDKHFKELESKNENI